MNVYIENPKEYTKKSLEATGEFSRVTEYKMYTQKSIIFLHTGNEQLEFEIKKNLN